MRIRCKIESELSSRSEVRQLAIDTNIPTPLAAMLYFRGVNSKEKATAFFHTEAYENLYSPYLFEDMEKAVDAILRHAENGEKILISGDYDVDGITSVAVLHQYLEGIGAVPVDFIPDRLSEGYGINIDALREMREQGITLMVTVDTGSTAAEEIAYARSIGIETVVTDHHECHSVLPECLAVINPVRPNSPYPFKGLAGVGVVFKLITAIEMRKRNTDRHCECVRELCEQYGDLIAMGTIADVMPLTEENRYIVHTGLRLIEKGKRPGVKALWDVINAQKKSVLSVSSSTVSYSIAPKINAAGRMGDAYVALKLMLADRPDTAFSIATELLALNLTRQAEENRIFSSAEEMLKNPQYSEKPILILYGDDWHMGVLGIVAAKLTEKYHKPTILIGFTGDEGRGSGRSVKGVNLVEALSENRDLLVKFGGHELAAGFTVERAQLIPLMERMEKAVTEMVSDETEEEIIVDIELSATDMTLPFAESLSLLEPCGNGNETPVFVLRNAYVADVLALSDGKYTKVVLEKEHLRFTGLMFDTATCAFPFAVSDQVDAVFTLSVNSFRGKKSVQLMLKMLLPVGTTQSEIQEEVALFHEICSGTHPKKLPSRAAFAAVYRQLSHYLSKGYGRLSGRYLSSVSDIPIALSEYLLICRIFKEAGLLQYRSSDKSAMLDDVSLIKVEEKVGLDSSSLYKRLSKFD